MPAQLGDPRAMTSTTIDIDEHDQAGAIHDYATRLHSRMVYAWAAAREATLYAQAGAVSDTTRTQDAEVRFEVGDRVCRKLPERANKLSYQCTGPYRVVEVMSDSRYCLTDTKNRMVRDEMHVSNL